MKNLITLVFTLLLTYSGFSQISDNTFYLGGGIGFKSVSTKISVDDGNDIETELGPSANILQFTVGCGYFINEKISLNLDVDYITGSAVQKSEISSIYEKANSTTFIINPYMRYLVMLEENKFGFTFDTGFLFGKGTSYIGENTGNSESKSRAPVTTTFKIGVTPGILYFPNEKIGLEASYGFIGYFRNQEKTTEDGVTATLQDSGFDFIANSLTPALNLGFKYYFQR